MQTITKFTKNITILKYNYALSAEMLHANGYCSRGNMDVFNENCKQYG